MLRLAFVGLLTCVSCVQELDRSASVLFSGACCSWAGWLTFLPVRACFQTRWSF